MKKYYFALVLTLFVLPFFAQNIPSYVPKDGLVGYWPFNGNANDESGNGNDGTNNGATLTTDRNGVVNSAYSFDGASNYIQVNNFGSSNFENTYTVSIWVYFNNFNNNYPMVLYGENDFIAMNGTGPAYSSDTSKISAYQGLYNQPNSRRVPLLMPKKTVEKQKFYHCVFVKNEKNASLYINNELVSTVPVDNSKPLPSGSFIQFGTAVSNLFNVSDTYFSGLMDDISIFNRALTEKEITALYTSCTSETATSPNFNSLLLSTGSSASLSAEPQGGVFTGASIDSNKFVPSKAKIGANKVQYNFKNSQGCNDSTLFTMIVADTVGTTCKKYDTLTVTKYDTVIVPKTVTKYDTVKVNTYDTITVTNSVTKYDTVIVNKTKYDTVIVPKTVTKYDTITFTNTVTKYDTVIVNKTKYDTVIVPKTVTKYDTVKVNTYDTITVTNNVTKYDTVIVPKTVTKYDTVKVNTYDTITVTNTVTKYDTVMVNKYDTITVTDTVSILKINFKLTTGIKANQMTSMSIYPNPTSDVLIIDASDLAAITGYSYRILDVLGKEVYNALVTSAKTEISLKTLGAKGMYVLHILDANKLSVQTKQIILE